MQSMESVKEDLKRLWYLFKHKPSDCWVEIFSNFLLFPTQFRMMYEDEVEFQRKLAARWRGANQNED